MASDNQGKGPVHNPWCTGKGLTAWSTPRGGSDGSRHRMAPPQGSSDEPGPCRNANHGACREMCAAIWEQTLPSDLRKCMRGQKNLEQCLPHVDFRCNLSHSGGKREGAGKGVEKQQSWIDLVCPVMTLQASALSSGKNRQTTLAGVNGRVWEHRLQHYTSST